MSVSKALGSDSLPKSFDNIHHTIKTRNQGLKISNGQICEHVQLKNKISTRLTERKKTRYKNHMSMTIPKDKVFYQGQLQMNTVNSGYLLSAYFLISAYFLPIVR